MILWHKVLKVTLRHVDIALYPNAVQGFVPISTYLNLEDAQSIHPSHEATQRGLSSTRHSDKQQMALRLSEDTVDTQYVV